MVHIVHHLDPSRGRDLGGGHADLTAFPAPKRLTLYALDLCLCPRRFGNVNWIPTHVFGARGSSNLDLKKGLPWMVIKANTLSHYLHHFVILGEQDSHT